MKLFFSKDGVIQNNESILESYGGHSQIDEHLSQTRLEMNNHSLMQVSTCTTSFYIQA